MRKSLRYSLISLLVLAMLVSPTFAWFYNDYPEPGKAADTKFEMFGPRVDRLLIKLYSTAEAEWEALKATPQELDLTDWPLAKAYYDQFTDPLQTYREKVNVESVGGEFGIRNLDMNQNDNPYLGAPQDPDYVNPKHNLADADSKNDHNPTSDLSMRQAILSCIDRAYYVANFIGSGFAVEHWSMLPPATGLQYYSETFRMYPFSPIAAAAYLEADDFKINAGTGWRYWDLDDDDVEDPDEYLELDFVIRSDDPIRNNIGIHLANTLEAAPVKVRVQRNFMDITGARTKWMLGKNAHLYTAGWSLGIEPDSIVLWMGDAGVGAALSYYWHPGSCYNTAYANDATFNINARIVEIANAESEAIAAMAICNQRAAEMALNGPMFVFSSTMANARTYVGGTPAEVDYVGRLWKGMVMVTGYGSDSFFGMLNMHPEGYPLPADGVIRYGFKTTDIRLFNTIYAEWVWDNNVLDLCYDALIASNPYALTQRLPWLCKNYTVGSYEHPTLGTCTKVRVTLRNDATWTDGTPITTDDVYFTLVELDDLLVARGLPKQWWYSAVKSILSFAILDPMNFEILINVKSIWAVGLTGIGVRLMPEHIWRPIIASATSEQIQGVHPDVNMITSGAWRFREYVSTSYVDLVANKPGRTVKTKFAAGDEGVPITSPKGFFRYYPKYVDIHADDYKSKIPLTPPATTVDVHFTVTDHNLLREEFNFTVPVPLDPDPVGKLLIYRTCEWIILQYVNQTPPPEVSYCDRILIQGVAPATPPLWMHVRNYVYNATHKYIILGQIIEANKDIYIDGIKQPWLIINGVNTTLPVHEYEKPCVPIVENFTVTLAKGYHVAKVVKTITTEWMLQQDNTVVTFPWITTITVEWPIWVTLKEDINLDFIVDIEDIYAAALAYGAWPGHARWNSICDLNGDYYVDIEDIYGIALKYGWI